MKTPEPSEENPSALDKRIFAYPKKHDSACAEVLARLLNGEALTAADTLAGASTMRAAAHVHYLRRTYGWPIVADDRTVGCKDGRVVTVKVYLLLAECTHAARSTGADAWCEQVRQARVALRIKAANAYRLAATLNKARSRPAPHPGQLNLFGGPDGERP